MSIILYSISLEAVMGEKMYFVGQCNVNQNAWIQTEIKFML